MDLEIAEASSQPNTEQMDDEFTATAYPKVQENLKLLSEGEVRLEEPASSAGTLSSMKNLDKDLSFTNQFLVEKSQEERKRKGPNTEDEDPIYGDGSHSSGYLNIADLVVYHNQALEERLDKQGNRIHQLETQDLSRLIREQTVEFIDSQEIDRKIEESVKEVVTASVQHAMRAPLRARFKDLPTSDMKEILLQRMLEENYDKGHEDHKMAYEALQKSIIRDESEKFDADKAEERTKKKSKQDSPKTPPGSPPSPPPPPPPPGASGASGTTGASDSAQDPPPPPPSSTTNRGDQSHSSAAPGSSKTAASTAYTAWTTTTSRLTPAASSVPEDVLMHEESDFEAQDMGSDDEDSGSRHIPKVSLNQEWFKPLSEKERPATPEPAWSIPSSSLPVPNSQLGTALPPLHGGMSQALNNQVDEGLLRYNVSRPLPLGGPPGQGDRLALSITKMKAASYPDAGLEQMVPDQMWVEEEYMYDISASYEWVFSLYGYDFMKKIVLRRADNQEYTIAESDFKDLYPSDFEDLYLLNLQGKRLPAQYRELPDSAKPHQTSLGSYRSRVHWNGYSRAGPKRKPKPSTEWKGQSQRSTK
ncbi:hypothetical protein Tco_0722141 [Tanacetum coccineum]